jgi:protein-L-isoaspartate(D-aspartate) O-methyltransferase
MEDSYKHKGMRKRMLEELKEMGMKDEKVLAAMNSVPRHFFLSSAFLEIAYQNKAFQIGAGQTISQPLTVAYQTSLLELVTGDKVLEIGTGSGSQTSVLCEMKAKVFSVERQLLLHENAKKILSHLGYNPKLYYGDGYKGLPVWAPFDKILVTCGAPLIPEALKQQLKIGGRMVIPVGETEAQIMNLVVRKSESDFEITELGKFMFVPMLSNRSKTSH